jgi:hypothetical protein
MKPVKQEGSFGDWNAWPAVFDGQAHPRALAPHHDADVATSTGIPAGVIDKYSGETIYPFGRSTDPGLVVPLSGNDDGDVVSPGDPAEPVGTSVGDGHQIDRLVTGRRWFRVEPGQPEQILDQSSQTIALATDPLESVAIAARVTWSTKDQTHLRFDHAERRAQLVRGIGGEFELASTGQFDRARRFYSDDKCAQIGGPR